MLYMQDLDLAGKRVLIREDLNVPLNNGRISSDARIQAALPTLRLALERGAAVMVLSHLGRPTEGQYDEAFSLRPVAERLADLLERPVRLERDWLEGIKLRPGEIVLCENVRFNVGEKANDLGLARRMAALCDIFVMDAFGTAHRAQASTEGIVHQAAVACAGPLLAAELKALTQALEHPKKPMLAIIGGSKVSSKLGVLRVLLDKVDQLIVGGGIANTLLAAAGYSIGQSLYEPEMLDEAQRLLASERIPLPQDVIVAERFAADAPAKVVASSAVAENEMILDVGPRTLTRYREIIAGAGTILWNGPVGVFEFPAFAAGTQGLAEAVATSPAFSIAGGGDTLAAINQWQLEEHISYVSTGGGAFLEFVEGRALPSIVALEQRG